MGGDCRFIAHAIEHVYIHECPPWMRIPGRLSYTFRDSVSMFGRENEFKTFDICDDFHKSQEKWNVD